jgi:predicted DCC family thiol-disulfide oxidoreductase YuxK
VERDTTDHFRFSPIQTNLARELCQQYDMPFDLSTAVLVDEEGGHVLSDSVLRLFPYLGFPYQWIGILALWLVPRFVRDAGYRVFAQYRGRIWKGVKRLTGMGDTRMEPYRDRMLGLEEPLDPSWALNKD